jgi:hypothetical protein
MKKVRVTLQRKAAAVGGDYRVTKIIGKIDLRGIKDEIIRAGDTVSEKQAEALNSAYTVTVTA